MMIAAHTANRDAAAVDDVVGVEVTIDGMLVIADRLGLSDFPLSLGIMPNIPQPDLRRLVWEQVARDLTAQGILDRDGEPHPEVAAMVDTLSRPDRILEGRWWRRDVLGERWGHQGDDGTSIAGKMVRFVISRKEQRHVVAARDDEMLVLQRVAPQIGLAGMVTAVLGTASAADVEPLTGVAGDLASCRTASQLAQYGISPASARAYAEIIDDPNSWVEITATERHPGGTSTQAAVAAGVLDARQGRIVSIPRRVNGELFGSFLPGTQENLQRALDGLVEFLPSRTWFDQADSESTETGTSYWD